MVARRYVRIHYLLDLIKLLPSAEVETMVRSAAPDAAGMHRFGAGASPYLASVGLNFTGLDKAMDQLHAAGLSPGFEVMGNPGNADDRSDRLFTDFSQAEQIRAWKDLVHAVASRYIQRYGLATVRKWRFERYLHATFYKPRNLGAKSGALGPAGTSRTASAAAISPSVSSATRPASSPTTMRRRRA